MSEKIPGCHHCIGSAVTVSNLIFNFIESWTVAHGRLTPEDLADLKSRFLASFSSGYDLFEGIHQECMEASRPAEQTPFSRKMILPTLLSACGKRAAKFVFKLEFEHCGGRWLDEFFFAFAEYVREHICRDAEPRLIAAFVEASAKYKSSLSVEILLGEPKVQSVLFDCIEVFVHANDREAIAKSVSASVNARIAGARDITGAHVAKTTKEEILQFLEMLPGETAQAIRGSEAASASVA